MANARALSLHAAALGVVLGSALLGYGFLLAPGRAPYSPFSDFVAGGLASYAPLHEALRGGRGLPFWRDDELSGSAALTNPQSADASPLNILFWLWPPLKAAGPTLWLYFLVAGAAGYACGWALELGFWPRILVAAAQMFSFKLVIAAFAGWLPGFAGVIVFPLLFAAAFRAVERPGPEGALLLALAFALCLSSGLQFSYYSALFLAAYAALRARCGALASLLSGAALAAGLCGCLLVPLAMDAPLLSRAYASYGFFQSGHALGLRHLLTFLRPEALGTPLNGSYPPVELWEDVAYFGLVPLALAAAGALLARRRPAARLLAAAFVVSVLLALRSPLQWLLFRVVPGFSLFRLPGRFLFLTSCFGSALAGLGLDEILRRLEGRVSKPLLTLGVLALLAAIAAEGSYYARRYIAMVPQERLLPRADYAGFFAKQRGVYRIVPLERSIINYGWAGPMGLQLVTGYGSYNYRRYQAYCDLLRWGELRAEGARVWTDVPSISRPDMLDALNVRYVVSGGKAGLPPDRFALSACLRAQPVFGLYSGLSSSDMYIYENRAALPRAFFVERTLRAGAEAEALSLIRRADLRSTAVLEGPAAGEPAPVSRPGEDRVAVEEAGAGRLAMTSRSRGVRYLVISEVWNPGWRATLDGRGLMLYKTDVALLGAWIPAGEHRIVLRFRPRGWDIGLCLTLASAAACLLLAAFILLRRPRG